MIKSVLNEWHDWTMHNLIKYTIDSSLPTGCTAMHREARGNYTVMLLFGLPVHIQGQTNPFLSDTAHLQSHSDSKVMITAAWLPHNEADLLLPLSKQTPYLIPSHTPQIYTMVEHLPLMDPFFATEEESNIINNNLPMQAAMNNGGHPDLLVCPPLPRNGIAEMWLHRVEKVCVTVHSVPHQTSSTTEPNSGVENNLGATSTHGHTTHHYTPQPLQLPMETTTLNTPVPFNANAHFSCECHSDEEGECRPKNGIPMEAVGDPPTTQQFVSGRTTWVSSHLTMKWTLHTSTDSGGCTNHTDYMYDSWHCNNNHINNIGLILLGLNCVDAEQ